MSSAASVAGRNLTPRPANRGRAPAAARLEGDRRASATLTHDLNNLLGVILSANERLATELPEGGEAQRLALLALEAAERAGALLRRGLAEAAAAPLVTDDEAVDCQQVLTSLRRIAGQAIAPGVRLKVYDL